MLDADALVAFAGQVDRLREALAGRPHPDPHAGEFRTLFPEEASGWTSIPGALPKPPRQRVGVTVLLKGVPTVIAGPGESDTDGCGRVTPGLATGG